jgi:hypothetical protein
MIGGRPTTSHGDVARPAGLIGRALSRPRSHQLAASAGRSRLRTRTPIQDPFLMRRALFTLITLTLVVTVAACQRDLAATECLEDPSRGTPVVATPGAPRWPADKVIIENGATVDARGVDFEGDVSAGSKYQYRVDSRQGICIVGGNYFTTLDREESPWDTIWHQRWGLIVKTPDTTIVGPNLYNTGDGIMFEGATPSNWQIIGANASGPDGAGAFIHDDCVENDGMHAGAIIESKFDGCAGFYSSILDPNPGVDMPDGSADEIVVAGTLVRLQSMKNSFAPTKYGYGRHGGFFKLAFADEGDLRGDGTPPKLVLRNSFFRSDDPAAYGGNTGGKLGVPAGTECTNVTIIGWEAWPTAEVASWERACGSELHKGSIDDWNQAVADWDASNPRI